MSAMEWGNLMLGGIADLTIFVFLFSVFPSLRPSDKYLPLACALITTLFGALHWLIGQPSSLKMTLSVVVYAVGYVVAYKMTERFEVKTSKPKRD